MKEYDAEPVIPYRKNFKVRSVLKVGEDFIVCGLSV